MGQLEKLEVSLEVIDETISEIGWTEEANSRQIPSAFQELTVAELRHLNVLYMLFWQRDRLSVGSRRRTSGTRFWMEPERC